MIRGPGRLHVITDETLQDRFTHLDLAGLAAAAGADVVQFREKRDWDRARLVQTARAMRDRIHSYGALLIVNDRVEIALEAGADGVHLGPGDLDPTNARQIVGKRAVIGVTANDLDRVRSLRDAPLSYLGIGPVFGTRSKTDPAPRLGLRELSRLVAESDRPVIAIGGITPDRVAEVLATGAHGIAVLSDITCRQDPGERVRRFREAINDAERGERDESVLAAR